jgi:hypothetical protein
MAEGKGGREGESGREGKGVPVRVWVWVSVRACKERKKETDSGQRERGRKLRYLPFSELYRARRIGQRARSETLNSNGIHLASCSRGYVHFTGSQTGFSCCK